MSGKQFFSARKILLAVYLAAGLGALIAPAAAQVYPNRPVKIVVPFVPGGPTEFIIRLLADRLTAMLGQAFVIENRPGGAGGTVGAKSVAGAAIAPRPAARQTASSILRAGKNCWPLTAPLPWFPRPVAGRLLRPPV